jgi:hypothetical protein
MDKHCERCLGSFAASAVGHAVYLCRDEERIVQDRIQLDRRA